MMMNSKSILVPVIIVIGINYISGLIFANNEIWQTGFQKKWTSEQRQKYIQQQQQKYSLLDRIKHVKDLNSEAMRNWKNLSLSQRGWYALAIVVEATVAEIPRSTYHSIKELDEMLTKKLSELNN